MNREKRPKSTAIFSKCFLLCCLLFSLAGLASPALFEYIGASRDPDHVVQYISFIFMHGASGQPVFIITHFLLNGIIIWQVGTIAEQQIGTKHIAILSLLAGIGYYLTQEWTGLAINGASGVIWAYSTVLFNIVWKNRKKAGTIPRELVDVAKFWLFIMWGAVTLFMGFLPYLFGSREPLWQAFFYGNIFHFQSVVIGLLYLWIFKPVQNH